MSKKFLTTPTLPMLPSPPSSYIAGDLYYDTTQNLLGIYTGTAWSYAISGVADNSVTDSKIGNRTINQSYLSATDTDTLNNLLNSFANRIAAITGSANWKNTPATTISELNTNAARKNLNEIINGNWTFANNLNINGDLTVSNTITGTLSGNASTATKLQTARTISLAGDVTGSTSFDGSANASINTSISSVPWNKVTSTPTTLSGYGITDAQPLNSKLTSISSLSFTGLIALTSSTATAARTLQGSTGRIIITNPDGVAGNPTIDLATSGVTAGTYTKVTTDAYGRITAGTTLAAADLPAHTHSLSDITSGTITLSGNITGSTTLTGNSTVTINTSIGTGVVQAENLATGASGLNLGVGSLSFGAIAWNSLTWTYGYYTVTAGGTGGSGTAPPTTENNGILQVQYSTGSNIIQTYIPRGSSTGDPAIYVRVYNISTSSWEAWRKIATPSSAVSLTTQSFTLSSNITLSTANTWVTIGSLNLSTGTWLVSCVATFWLTATGARNYFARLINLGNNTAFAGSQIYVPSANPSGGSISLTALVTGGITMTFQGASSLGSTSNVIRATTTLDSVPATLMTAVKIA